MWWRKNRAIEQITTEHPKSTDIYRIRAIFNNFRKILELNTIVFETIAEMDRTLGGEYVFDKNYLEESVRTISSHVHHVTYSLNALTENAHIPIYDKYQEIRSILDDILVGNYKALYCPPVMPLHTLSWELEPLVGINLICLAELQHHQGIQAATGIVLTSGAATSLAGQPEYVSNGPEISRQKVADALSTFLQDHPKKNKSNPLVVTSSQIDEDVGETRDLGEFSLTPTEDGADIVLRETLSEISSGHTPLEQTEQKNFQVIPDERTQGATTLEKYLNGIQRVSRVVHSRLHKTADSVEPTFALFIRRALPPLLSGTVTTRTRLTGPVPLLRITAHPSQQQNTRDRYWLKRLFPFNIISSNLSIKPVSYQFPGEEQADRRLEDGRFMRGSSLLKPAELTALAETAMTLERIMGVPVTVQWELTLNGDFIITRLFPFLEKPEEPTAAELSEEMDNAVILAEGGRVVQSGVAAGIVVHITDQMNPEDFPLGAIAVAPAATPQLTPFLHRASALLTEQGKTIGHLATVARELNLPALFGIPGIVNDLHPGQEITLDSGMRCVFKGVVKSLVQLGNSEMAFSPVDTEYRILRRLLRFISPLNLVDTESPDFSAQQCRTYHDIIHYCHEAAVDELAHFQERRPELHGLKNSQLRLPIAMDINLLDIGNGLHATTNQEITLADISSIPFAVFLDGLLHPLAGGNETPSLGVRNILNAIPKTLSQMNSQPELLTGNLAIIGRKYMNLSLRLGYHFSVIDAHFSADRNKNYIYFRFIGGMAEAAKRERRAQFIADVLATMDFKVELNGDLVVGRIKFEHQDTLRRAIFVLGALTTCTRQQDILLDNQRQSEQFFRNFAATFLLPYGKKSSTEDSHSSSINKAEEFSMSGGK
ncbi:PEP-utilizing enzyme [Desulfogranum japonicum]|uniref:PEP-utilizing enzyme n=1 Tax=Desulfogranum japonicum TaxID=231447 RepID=UPI0003FEDA53|nr:PEP-utilizing enzyme [Desulfogranum japonicum]